MRQYRLDFLIELIRRRIIEKYVGSAFVLLWVMLVPVVPLLTNLLIFYYIAKVPQVKEMGVIGYSVFVFSGLLPYRILQKGLTEGSELITNNMELLKNAIFPLQFLGMTALGAILFEFSLQIIVLLILLLVSGIWISLNMLLLPVAILLLSALILGCVWIISVVGYLLKDIREVINVILLGLVYVTPTMYPTEAAPRTIQKVIEINPLTHMIIVFRDVWTPCGDGLAISSWAYFAAVSLLLVMIGYVMMRKVSGIVGDLV